MTTTTPPPRLPFFVYGTLMQGCGNDYRIREDIADVHSAVLPGHVMRAAGYLPYVIPASPGQKAAELGPVHGELVTIKPGRYERVLQRLDGLESYNPDAPHMSLYVRTKVTVITPDSSDPAVGTFSPAWVYLGGLIAEQRKTELVVSGDWHQWKRVIDTRRANESRAYDLAREVMRRTDAIEALTWVLTQPDSSPACPWSDLIAVQT